MKRLDPILLAFAITTACVVQPAPEVHERGSSAPGRTSPLRPRIECVAVPEHAVLVLEASAETECPVVLVLSDPPDDVARAPDAAALEPTGRWVALIQLPRESATEKSSRSPATEKSSRSPATEKSLEPLATGPAPLACGPTLAGCELSGIVDATHGPIVLAAERGYESEHPVQIHVGLHEGAKLAFIPSWVGESSVVDHTRLGPAFALAPFDCAGELRLLPAARLPEAQGEHPPGRAMMLAGHWWIGDRGQAMPPQAPNPSSEGCTALLESLP